LVLYGTADYYFTYHGYPGFAYAYFWYADVDAWYNDYYGDLYYVYYYGGVYGWYGNDVVGMGAYADLWYNTYYQWGSFAATVDLDYYTALFIGDYNDLYYIYTDYYWLAAGAVSYCYTWWWWGHDSPESYYWSGVSVGVLYGTAMSYTAYYYVDYDFNTWEYADFTLGYGSVTVAYLAYGYKYDWDDATFVGTYEYSWWYLTYDGWTEYSFGYYSLDLDVVGYGLLSGGYVSFVLSMDLEYGWFSYEDAVIYGSEFDFDNLFYGDSSYIFYGWNPMLMTGYYM